MNNFFNIQSDDRVDVHIVEKCDNCSSTLINCSDIEQTKKVKIKDSISSAEILIWDALAYIYGDPCKSPENCKLKKNVFGKYTEDLKFCSICTSLLSENYNSHHNFQNSTHPGSLIVQLRKEFQTNHCDSSEEIQKISEFQEEIEKETRECLFEDFTFEDPDDEHVPESLESKYEPNILEDTSRLPLLSGPEENSDSSRRESLRSWQPYIKVEKLCEEEIGQFITKEAKKKHFKKIRKRALVKNSNKIESVESINNNVNETNKKYSRSTSRVKLSKNRNSSILFKSVTSQKRGHKEIGDEATNTTHKDKNNMCHICGKAMKSKQALTIHQICVHASEEEKNQWRTSCKECGDVVYTFRLQSHIDNVCAGTPRVQNTISNPELFQEIVKEALENNSEIPTTFKSLSVEGRHVCNICGKGYSLYNSLRTHWYRNHVHEKGVCNICGKEFKSKKVLKFHKIRLHASEEEKSKWRTTCKECGDVVFTFKLKQHIDFSCASNPRVRKKYKCDQCSMEYATKNYLKDHLLTHIEGPQQCDVCSKVFLSSKRLMAHKNAVHVEKVRKFFCEKCPSAFVLRCELRTHEACHEDSRKYVCETCGKSYKYPTHLRSHLKCHQEIEEKGENAFTCDICNNGTRFAHSLSLRNHKLLKHGANRKIYQCSFCGKQLSCATNLRQHEALHKESPAFNPRASIIDRKIRNSILTKFPNTKSCEVPK